LAAWHTDWAWGLPLIVLNVVIHLLGLSLINERVVRVLSSAMDRRHFTGMFVVVMGNVGNLKTEEFSTVAHRCVLRLMTVAALLCAPGLTLAQAPTSSATTEPPPPKSTVKADMVPSLFVMNAHGASLQGQTLTLTGVSPNSIVFADRPVRSAGHLLTEHLLEEWTVGSFAKDPPNATVSVLSKDGASVRDAVVELKIPHLEGDKLTFDVRVLEGDLAGADGPASVFVDIIGLPFTPLSFAGVARRTARRAAWYGAAAAAPYPPYGYPPYGYPPPYYPYPAPY